MRIVTETAAAMQAVFGKYLDELSRTTGCVQRERKFSGMSLMRTFVLTLLQNPAAKDRDYRAMAAKLGVPVTEKAITLRFTDGLSRFFEESLKQAVAQTLAAKPAARSVVAEVHGCANRRQFYTCTAGRTRGAISRLRWDRQGGAGGIENSSPLEPFDGPTAAMADRTWPCQRCHERNSRCGATRWVVVGLRSGLLFPGAIPAGRAGKSPLDFAFPAQHEGIQ